MPLVPLLLMLASAGSDTVDPAQETVAELAEKMSSAPFGLAFRQRALDYHRRMSLVADAAEAAGKNQGLRERPVDPQVVLAIQSVAEGLRLCP